MAKRPKVVSQPEPVYQSVLVPPVVVLEEFRERVRSEIARTETLRDAFIVKVQTDMPMAFDSCDSMFEVAARHQHYSMINRILSKPDAEVLARDWVNLRERFREDATQAAIGMACSTSVSHNLSSQYQSRVLNEFIDTRSFGRGYAELIDNLIDAIRGNHYRQIEPEYAAILIARGEAFPVVPVEVRV